MTYSIIDAGARERMIVSTALLIRERGARSTSIDDVLAHSGAPRGSVYHHFPGGRAQLLARGDRLRRRVRRRADRARPRARSSSSTRSPRPTASSSIAADYRAGCPIVAVAVEAGERLVRPPASDAAAAFAPLDGAARRPRSRPTAIAPKRAPTSSPSLVIASIEGAIVLARAERSVEPLDTVHRELRTTVETEITGEEAPMTTEATEAPKATRGVAADRLHPLRVQLRDRGPARGTDAEQDPGRSRPPRVAGLHLQQGDAPRPLPERPAPADDAAAPDRRRRVRGGRLGHRDRRGRRRLQADRRASTAASRSSTTAAAGRATTSAAPTAAPS